MHLRLRQQHPIMPFSFDVTLNGGSIGGFSVAPNFDSFFDVFFELPSLTAPQFDLRITQTTDNPCIACYGTELRFEDELGAPSTITLSAAHGTPGVVPEPTTYALMATGLVGLFGFARRRNVV